jgi:hypothetical protein
MMLVGGFRKNPKKMVSSAVPECGRNIKDAVIQSLDNLKTIILYFVASSGD